MVGQLALWLDLAEGGRTVRLRALVPHEATRAKRRSPRMPRPAATQFSVMRAFPVLLVDGNENFSLPFGEKSSLPLWGGEKGALPEGGPVAARHAWLAWPWASQAAARGRLRVSAVLATRVPWACEWAAGCARGRRALVHSPIALGWTATAALA